MAFEVFGSWWAPGADADKVSGVLRMRDFQQPELELVGSHFGFGRSEKPRKTQPGSDGADAVPLILGEVLDFGPVSLFGCRDAGFTGMGGTGGSVLFRAEYATLGGGLWLSSRDEKHFRRIELIVPALAEMIGDRPIRNNDPNYFGLFNGDEVHLTIDDCRKEWPGPDVSVSWEYKRSGTSAPGRVVVESEPAVVFTSRHPKSLSFWFDNWIWPTQKLILLATGQSPAVSRVDGYHRKHLGDRDYFNARSQIFFPAIGERDDTAQKDHRSPTLTADHIIRSRATMANLLTNVIETEETHPLFTSLILGCLGTPDRPLRNRLLDVTSGLEAFDSVANPVTDTERESHAAAYEAVLRTLSSTETAQRRFARQHLRKSPDSSLEQRIHRLMKQSGFDPKVEPTPNAIATTRNLVAHGKAIDQPQLKAVYERTLDLARIVLFNELGVEPRHGPPQR